MPPTVDIGLSVGAGAIANGQIHHSQVKFSRSEDKVEISEWIELAKIGAVLRDGFIIFTEKDFRATECIFELLPQQPTEGHSEQLVCHHVKKLHRLSFHW